MLVINSFNFCKRSLAFVKYLLFGKILLLWNSSLTSFSAFLKDVAPLSFSLHFPNKGCVLCLCLFLCLQYIFFSFVYLKFFFFLLPVLAICSIPWYSFLHVSLIFLLNFSDLWVYSFHQFFGIFSFYFLKCFPPIHCFPRLHAICMLCYF